MKANPIKFFTIPPLHHLDLMEINDRYFFLAHFLDNQNYKEFVKTKIAQRKHVIIDNGAAEGKDLSVEGLIDIAEQFLPTEIIPPDRLLNCNTTLHLLDLFERQWMSRSNATPELRNIGLIGVPQGNTPLSWMRCYITMAADPLVTVIGMSKISIPESFKLITKTTDLRTNRNYIISQLLAMGLVVKPLHLLGMRDPAEYTPYDSPMIRSSDSCFAVLAASQNCNLCDADFTQSTPPEYFNYILSQKSLTVAKYNIEDLNKVGK